jgi:hypothetical protein
VPVVFVPEGEDAERRAEVAALITCHAAYRRYHVQEQN